MSPSRNSQINAPQFVVATVVGGVTVLVTGHLFFTLALGNFYAYAMNAGSATGVAREPQLFWPIALGALSYSALLTLAIATRGRPSTVAAGVQIGTVVSFLLWLTADLMLYGISNVGNLTTTLIDPVLELVPGAIAGGAIAATLVKMRSRGDAVA